MCITVFRCKSLSYPTKPVHMFCVEIPTCPTWCLPCSLQCSKIQKAVAHNATCKETFVRNTLLSLFHLLSPGSIAVSRNERDIFCPLRRHYAVRIFVSSDVLQIPPRQNIHFIILPQTVLNDPLGSALASFPMTPGLGFRSALEAAQSISSRVVVTTDHFTATVSSYQASAIAPRARRLLH